MNERDPQAKALLEQFKVNAAHQHPATHILGAP
jgi:hypothetical protein